MSLTLKVSTNTVLIFSWFQRETSHIRRWRNSTSNLGHGRSRALPQKYGSALLSQCCGGGFCQGFRNFFVTWKIKRISMDIVHESCREESTLELSCSKSLRILFSFGDNQWNINPVKSIWCYTWKIIPFTARVAPGGAYPYWTRRNYSQINCWQ